MPKTETATETVLESGPTDATPKQYCADGCGARVGNPKSTFLQGHDQRLVSRLAIEVVEDTALSEFARTLLTLTDYRDSDDIQARIDQVHARVILRFSVGLGDKFNSAAMRRWELYGRKTERAAQKALKAAAPKRTRKTKRADATTAVSTALQTDAPNSSDPVGVSFTMSSLTEYRKQATAWLGDKSEVTSADLDNADWTEIYEYFKGFAQVDEAAPESTVGQEIVNLRGTEVQVKIGRWEYTAVVHGMNQRGKVTAVEYTDKKGETKTTDKFTLVS